jgi:hypoxanthine phosphoribosyltransferase
MIERVEPYIEADAIAARTAELGREISAALADAPNPPVFVCVLKGSILFYADLLRQLEVPCNTAFLAVSSYEGGTSSTGAVRLTHDLTIDIEGRDVVIVEDIIDTGLTMAYLVELLGARKPRSLRVATLLHKPARKKVDAQMDWVGFTIDDVFVVGYGLDYDQRYRYLPCVGVMHFDAA